MRKQNSIKSLNNNFDKEYNNILFQEIPFVKKINLRGDPDNQNFMTSAESILNSVLPTNPNTYKNTGELKIIWLAPDEWLVIDENNKDNKLLEKLQQVLGDQEASATDVSENRTILRIFGNKVDTLLSKFLLINLDKVFSYEFSATQTLFVKVPILIVQNFDKEKQKKIDIYVNRSQANYVYDLLIDGAKNLYF